MTRRLRVLVVDDSAVVRKLIADAVQGAPGLELCAIASNGRQALERLESARPDLATLDLEMPVLDGIGTLRELRRLKPALPVLVVSSHTERGALATLDALAAGASDFVAKPRLNAPDEARRFVEAEVLPRLRALAVRIAGPPAPVAGPAPAPPQAHRLRQGLRPRLPVKLVAIASSTGGPQALEVVLSAFPAGFPVPVAVVQHMPPMFTRLLAERLNSRSALEVAEAYDGAHLVPGKAWLARGGLHLLATAGQQGPALVLGDGPPESSCKPAADPLLRSAVEVYGGGVLAVVLTGMGSDGLAGCRAVREAGGAVLAQDQASSVVWGMPGSVVTAGVADEVLPLGDVAAAIVQRTGALVARAREAS